MWFLSGTRSNADVIYLERDKPAPFAGYLFSPDKEKEARLGLIDLDFANKKIVLQDTIIQSQTANLDFYKQRLDLYKNETTTLAKQLEDNRSVQFWEKGLYFLAGAFLTGVISYGVVNTLK